MKFKYLVLPATLALTLLIGRLPHSTAAQQSGGSHIYLPLFANTFTEPAILPNDTRYSDQQWDMQHIDLPKAWFLSQGSRDITIAIIDTGVDADHPEFSGRLAEGKSFVVDSATCPARSIASDDDQGHGTHVAGISAASGNNADGIAGIAWESTILPVKVMDCLGSGQISDIVAGVRYAVDNGARVINLSLGWSPCSLSQNLVQSALDYAYDHNVVVLAAAGNYGSSTPICPAALNHVISVAAVDVNIQRPSYSTYNQYVDIAAPGGSSARPVISTYPSDVANSGSGDDTLYHGVYGTSQAAPHVAGVVALMLARNPNLTPDQVQAILQDTALDLGTPGRDDYYGYGLVQAAAAVKAAENPPALLQSVPADTTPLVAPPAPGQYTPGQVVVQWQQDTSASERQELVDRLGAQVAEQPVAGEIEVLAVPEGQEQAVSQALRQSPLVADSGLNGEAVLVQ